MKTKQNTPKTRPYWHVDLKWIFGLMALLALGGSLLLFNLAALTEREKATTLSATVVASLFSKEGLDSDEGLNEFRQQAQATPGDKITPIPQFPWLQIDKQDALTLGPRELRIKIFKQLTEPIYDKGLEGASKDMAKTPEDQKAFVQQAALLGVFTKKTHETFKKGFTWLSIAAVILIAATIYFSAGWGRLVSPGILLLAVSPLGSLFGLMLLHPPKDDDGPFTALPVSVTQEIGNSLSQTYLIATMLGISLIFIALIGKIATRIIRKHKAPKA